jgi:hypothetical protein
MNLTDISNLRLINQQIAKPGFTTAGDIVSWMGAMQAQDYSMAKWALGIRLPGSTDELIESEIDKGKIIRTHALRPTWHFVSADDIYWMLDLTGTQIKASMKSRDKQLGLTENLVKKSNSIVEKALSGGNHLTREELVAELVRNHIDTGGNRASHLFLRAEIDGIICSGITKANKPTYTLLSEWVSGIGTLEREEALMKLARRYFTSHGPATLQDFVWWSGLSVNESKQALEMIRSDFDSETIDYKTYWFTNDFSVPRLENDLIYLLPAYDEFIISYQDRTASLPSGNHIKAVSDNGIFRPSILINGQVKGTWKRWIKKDKVILETNLFDSQDKTIKNRIEKASARFSHFLNKKVEIIHRS